MQLPSGIQMVAEEILVGEIDDLKIEHLAYVGPIEQTIDLVDRFVSMFLFIEGNGTLYTDSINQQVSPESIAIPSREIHQVKLKVNKGDSLHVLQFTKKMSPKDLEDLKHFPEENIHKLFIPNLKIVSLTPKRLRVRIRSVERCYRQILFPVFRLELWRR